MKASNPNEASLFLQNWNMLDRVVKTNLGVAAGKRKSSKKTRRIKRK
jgi:hypothetical protein